MRWKNGAPKVLYVVVVNADASVHTFERKQARTAWIAKRTPTYSDGTYVFATFDQRANLK